jgi:RimJ/RimL family protein N-acetyltransferase
MRMTNLEWVDLPSMLSERLYTRRLSMRRIGEADLPLMLAWSNSDAAFGPYLTPERHTVRTLAEQFAGGVLWNRGDKTFLVETRPAGRPIGTIHYWLRQNQQETAVISVKIAAVDERGKGYGTEAQKFLIIHLFDQIGVRAVEMYTDIDNAPQQRCLSKLGFRIIESLTYDDRRVLRTGYLYQLTHDEYQRQAIYRFNYE